MADRPRRPDLDRFRARRAKPGALPSWEELEQEALRIGQGLVGHVEAFVPFRAAYMNQLPVFVDEAGNVTIAPADPEKHAADTRMNQVALLDELVKRMSLMVTEIAAQQSLLLALLRQRHLEETPGIKMTSGGVLVPHVPRVRDDEPAEPANEAAPPEVERH